MRNVIATILRFLFLASLAFFAACHKSEPVAAAATPSIQQQRMEQAAEVPPATQKVWTYLNRLRQEDAFSPAIARTLVNDQNQLGLVLYSKVTPAQIPELIHKLMTEMAQEFPHRDLTLVIYGESSPLHQVGTAHLDGQTGAASYTPR
ncbi:MAG TPA: hypothetical protein VGF73_06850 [Chthoniobacterales bacterium]